MSIRRSSSFRTPTTAAYTEENEDLLSGQNSNSSLPYDDDDENNNNNNNDIGDSADISSKERPEACIRRPPWIQIVCALLLADLIAIAILSVRQRIAPSAKNRFRGSGTKSNPTFRPTLAPTTSSMPKFTLIQSIVQTVTGYSIDDFESPQYQAIHWLAFEDEYNLNVTDVEMVLQRYVLATIYFSTEDISSTTTSSSSYESSSSEDGLRDLMDECNFLASDQHVCEWHSKSEYYASFYGPNATCGVQCDVFRRHVIELNIEPNTLNGTLPEEIGLLKNLIWLQIEGNENLIGSLPSSIGQLDKLSVLHLEKTGLTGTVPSSLGNLSKLMLLSLIGNKFHGTIPSTLAQLSGLRFLWLYANELTGTISPLLFQKLSNTLESLNLRENYLTGSLPITAATTNKKLKRLQLGDNILDGTIPYGLFSFKNLLVFDIHDNLFTGTLSMNYTTFTDLSAFDVSTNQFTGIIPSTLFGTTTSWTTSLEMLRLHRNNFTGIIPTELGNLRNLRILTLFSNAMLTGNIPSEIGNLASLGQLAIGVDSLSGSIPEELGNLVRLQWLTLERSEIGGTVPLSFANMQSLRIFSLAGTNLVGNMDFMSNMAPFSFAMANCLGDDPKIICSFCTHCCDDDNGCFVRGTNETFDYQTTKQEKGKG